VIGKATCVSRRSCSGGGSDGRAVADAVEPDEVLTADGEAGTERVRGGGRDRNRREVKARHLVHNSVQSEANLIKPVPTDDQKSAPTELGAWLPQPYPHQSSEPPRVASPARPPVVEPVVGDGEGDGRDTPSGVNGPNPVADGGGLTAAATSDGSAGGSAAGVRAGDAVALEGGGAGLREGSRRTASRSRGMFFSMSWEAQGAGEVREEWAKWKNSQGHAGTHRGSYQLRPKRRPSHAQLGTANGMPSASSSS